jgi:hypothetical protein
MARELGRPVDFAAVKSALASHMAAVFEREWLPAVDSP